MYITFFLSTMDDPKKQYKTNYRRPQVTTIFFAQTTFLIHEFILIAINWIRKTKLCRQKSILKVEISENIIGTSIFRSFNLCGQNSIVTKRSFERTQYRVQLNMPNFYTNIWHFVVVTDLFCVFGADFSLSTPPNSLCLCPGMWCWSK